MVRKILVVLLIMVMLCGITVMVKADDTAGSPVPDIITNEVEIIFVSPNINSDVIAELKKGTLGIVSWSSYCRDRTYIGFDVPGASVGTDVVICVDGKISVAITTPVALKLQNGSMSVYFGKKLNIVSLPWNDLSISEVQSSWFPKYINARIVKIKDTGASKSEINYCCHPALIKKSYFYKIYLATNADIFKSPSEEMIDMVVGVMIPDYLVSQIKNLADNGGYYDSRLPR